MIVPRWSSDTKHLFVMDLDIEQMFVVDCAHGEQVFGRCEGGVVVAVWVDGPGDPSDSRWTGRPGPQLRLVDGAGVVGHRVGMLPEWERGMGLPSGRLAALPGGAGEERAQPATRPAAHRRVSAKVRRRRLAVAGVAAVALTLALLPQPRPAASPASLPVEAAGATYVVRPGDTLWSIATRVDPTGDPRPLVARLYAETGTYAIVPGERIRIP